MLPDEHLLYCAQSMHSTRSASATVHHTPIARGAWNTPDKPYPCQNQNIKFPTSKGASAGTTDVTWSCHPQWENISAALKHEREKGWNMKLPDGHPSGIAGCHTNCRSPKAQRPCLLYSLCDNVTHALPLNPSLEQDGNSSKWTADGGGGRGKEVGHDTHHHCCHLIFTLFFSSSCLWGGFFSF